MPHVVGAAGNIVAILWAKRDALHAPALPNRRNKIRRLAWQMRRSPWSSVGFSRSATSSYPYRASRP